MDRSSRTISIVCFGDSLTAGYQAPTPDNPGGAETPYGVFLEELLGGRACIAISGVCGELTRHMVARFARDVIARHPDYVVILGGTNDLGWDLEPEEIIRNLITMYDTAIQEQVQPVAVTIPSIRADAGGDPSGAAWIDAHLRRRRIVNAWLVEHAAKRAMPCVDLFAETAEPGTGRLAARYSNDGLHLTTAGYRLLADLVARQVGEHARRRRP
ncbi:SGNH/GDSL hydrolase family protein [Candidatus Nitrospira bockiana]